MLAAFHEVMRYAKEGDRGDNAAILSDDAEKYLSRSAYHTLHRCPFLTSKAKLGLGRDIIEANDAIFILSGFRTPFIFRSVGNGQYRLIGEAYVHGIMDGEAVVDGVIFETIEVI